MAFSLAKSLRKFLTYFKESASYTNHLKFNTIYLGEYLNP